MSRWCPSRLWFAWHWGMWHMCCIAWGGSTHRADRCIPSGISSRGLVDGGRRQTSWTPSRKTCTGCWVRILGRFRGWFIASLFWNPVLCPWIKFTPVAQGFAFQHLSVYLHWFMALDSVCPSNQPGMPSASKQALLSCSASSSSQATSINSPPSVSNQSSQLQRSQVTHINQVLSAVNVSVRCNSLRSSTSTPWTSASAWQTNPELAQVTACILAFVQA